MKLRKLLFGLALIAFSAQAQYTIIDDNGNAITDGQEFVFGDNTIPGGYLNFFVTNDSDAPINMKIEFVSTNNSGDVFQICFGGQCISETEVGESYPPGPPATIDAGDTTGEGNHLFNYGESAEDILEYVCRFYQLDEAGNEVGDDLTVTYRYNPLLSIDEVEAQAGISISSTILKNTLDFSAAQAGTLSLYDVQGRLVTTASFESGQQTVDVSSLSAQVYIASFRTVQGANQSIRLLKK